jgi:predicted N-formylglutamate amidohydrolase
MTPDAALLHPAYRILDAEAPGPWVVTCDHATNHVPRLGGRRAWGGGPGASTASDMERHIAYDIGAAGLAQALSRRLDSPAILAALLAPRDRPQPGEDDPTLLMRL